MKFILIDANKQMVSLIEADELNAALEQAGLSKGEVDFGTVSTDLGIVVHEFGMREPVDKRRYFTIQRYMYAGNAVLFAFDQIGDTITANEKQLHYILSHIKFLGGHENAERAIAAGVVDRPQIAVNGEVMWQWPQGNAEFKGKESL